MVVEKTTAEVNKEIDDEIEKLIESMSGLNVEHKKTLNICYAEYFEQRVHEFQHVEKQVRLLIRTFASYATEFIDIQLIGDIHKFSEEFWFHTREGLYFIKLDGFGIDRCRKSKIECKQPAAKAEMKSTSTSPSKDNFCDFILNDRQSDREVEIIALGAVASDSNAKTPMIATDTVNLVTSPNIQRDAAKEVKSLKIDKPESNVSPMKIDVLPMENDVAPIEVDVLPSTSSGHRSTENIKFPKTVASDTEKRVELPNIDELEIDPPSSPTEIDDVSPSLRHSNVPIRLRFKRNLHVLMTKPETSTTEESSSTEEEVERKRKR